ncbi:hypothetical protein H920_04812 [Fukomys damarensis]|uniref:Uncharacterized protein n=1 Tax=Fukomys damarensis TaxID=885580 RepID=A0A091DTM5_FUKDA|nr:hypothetical protein H920_04812 [Fukomys damarensis]
MKTAAVPSEGKAPSSFSDENRQVRIRKIIRSKRLFSLFMLLTTILSGLLYALHGIFPPTRQHESGRDA